MLDISTTFRKIGVDAARNSDDPFKLFDFSTALRLRPCVISFLASRFLSAVEILSPRQHK